MVMYKQSSRADHDCIYHFNLRHAQDANLVFHRSSSDAIILYDNMPASALNKVAAFAGEGLFARKSTTFDQARGDGIDLPYQAKPEEP